MNSHVKVLTGPALSHVPLYSEILVISFAPNSWSRATGKKERVCVWCWEWSLLKQICKIFPKSAKHRFAVKTIVVYFYFCTYCEFYNLYNNNLSCDLTLFLLVFWFHKIINVFYTKISSSPSSGYLYMKQLYTVHRHLISNRKLQFRIAVEKNRLAKEQKRSWCNV